METRIDGFIFYRSYWDALNMMSDNADKIKVIDALCDYAFYGSDEKGNALEGIGKAIFIIAQPLIDTSIKNYQNGKKGGRPSNTIQMTTVKTPVLTPVLTNNNNNNNLNLNTKKNLNLNTKKNKKENIKEIDDDNNNHLSSIPLFPEVVDFINENQLSVDAKKFFTYYTKKNWNGVSDWQTALLGWEENLKKWDKTKVEAEEDEYAKLW